MTDLRAQPATIELAASDQLSVVFTWTQDRYAHRIVAGGEAVATSVEGSPNQDFPPSPPLQQLSLENLNGRDVVLGVGAAGRGHWSVSVEPVKLEDGLIGLKFDWACRTGDVDAELRTTYGNVRADLQPRAESSTAAQRDQASLTLRPANKSSSPTHQWTYTFSIRPESSNA